MIKIYEKFSDQEYLDAKKKREQKGIQKLGDKFILDIVADGDFDGLNYLLDTGYKLKNSVSDENLLTIALINNQRKMLDYLLKTDYCYDWDNPINSIILTDIIGKHNYNDPNIITPEMVEWLKIITEYGYDFSNDQYNYFELYLTENVFYKNGKNVHEFIEGLEPFIDWILEHYPKFYPLVEKYLPDNLRKKYEHLEDANKYNL